ncbi:cysteine proteinase [Testicularia cyperi]|uniref:Ubiquitin carboxyl-terminal hydrolase n=1 Tax=Testicularia cyperi TaxID=1882483 RepID=A0A317XKV2_9BASI|nr:cysteine proteinase [Testicularia cyperi]
MSDATSTTKWVPLESNPELFSEWSSAMGLDTSRFAFHDIFGLDEELLMMVPQPVQAVLLLFPITEAVQKMRNEEDEDVEEATEAEAEGEVMWFKQTIGNACGTIGLLHALANTEATKAVSKDSPLDSLLSKARPLAPIQRADLLTKSKELESVHSQTASGGQSAAPEDLDNVILHFVCFIRDRDGNLVELDGGRKGPLKRGSVPTQDQLLPKAVEFIKQKYVSRTLGNSADSVLFQAAD